MRAFVTTVMACLALPATVLSATIVVDAGGTGDYLTIQEGIDAAASGDDVLVLPGTYLENIDFSGKDLWVHSSAGASSTALDGSSGPVGQASCVAARSGEGPGAVLEGFTVRGGTGSLHPVWGTIVGGGLVCMNASITVRNCIFEQNTALNGAAGWIEEGSVAFSGTDFRENVSETYGSAVSILSASGVFTDCVFEDNEALSNDGCVSMAQNGAGVFEDCVFRGNTASAGGALNIGQSSAACTVRRCEFYGNSALSDNGGAIRVHEGSLVLEDAVLAGNHSAVRGGGLIVFDGASATISRSTFFANGSVGPGGQLTVASEAGASVQNSIFSEGTSSGGIYSEGVSFECCNTWGNVGGNYLGQSDPTGTNGNISENPLFCDPAMEDFQIRSDSPCAPDNSQECGLIGALPVGCTPPVPVVATTWGKLKSSYAH